jgi:hypothetical protein
MASTSSKERWADTHSRLAAGEYDEKDPRWRATHDALTLPEYKREALATLDAGPSRPPLRVGTGASTATFASTSTADVAQAGIERWDTESAASTSRLGTTTTASTADSSVPEERRRFWKGRKGKSRSRN